MSTCLAKGFISHVLDIVTLFIMIDIMILINFLEQFHLLSYQQFLFGKNINNIYIVLCFNNQNTNISYVHLHSTENFVHGMECPPICFLKQGPFALLLEFLLRLDCKSRLRLQTQNEQHLMNKGESLRAPVT